MSKGHRQFHIDLIADISTSELTKRDRELIMRPEFPHHLANHDHEYGAIFYTQDDPALLGESLTKLRAAGFSRKFCSVFAAASKDGVRYVRFDADGQLLKIPESTKATRPRLKTSSPGRKRP